MRLQSTLAMLLSCWVSAGYGESITNTVLTDTFDARPLGALVANGGWVAVDPTSLNDKRRLEVMADSGDLLGGGTDNQILFFQNIAANPGTYITTLSADGLSSSAVLMVSFDFHETAATTGGITIKVGSDPDATNPVNEFTLTDGAVGPSGGYSVGALHHLDAIFNESGAMLDYDDPVGGSSSLATGLMDIWIDNVRVAAGVTQGRSASPPTQLSSLFLTSDGGNQEIYFDNIEVLDNGIYVEPPPPPPELALTNLVVSSGKVTLEWNQSSDHYIVVSGTDLASFPVAGTVEISETSTSNSAAVFPYTANRGFFQVMLNIATNGSPVSPALRTELKAQSSVNAPTNKIYDVDFDGISGMTLPGQEITMAELGEFANLDKLSLAGSGLTTLGDFSIVNGITWLNLSSNQLTEVSALSTVISLEALDLQDNLITDLTGIESLVHLRWLDLENNQIDDLALVVANAANGGLGEGDELWVRGNPLSATATNQIQNLETNFNVRVIYE